MSSHAMPSSRDAVVAVVAASVRTIRKPRAHRIISCAHHPSTDALMTSSTRGGSRMVRVSPNPSVSLARRPSTPMTCVIACGPSGGCLIGKEYVEYGHAHPPRAPARGATPVPRARQPRQCLERGARRWPRDSRRRRRRGRRETSGRTRDRGARAIADRCRTTRLDDERNGGIDREPPPRRRLGKMWRTSSSSVADRRGTPPRSTPDERTYDRSCSRVSRRAASRAGSS